MCYNIFTMVWETQGWSALPQKEGGDADMMTTFQALVLMIAFASLVVSIVKDKK